MANQPAKGRKTPAKSQEVADDGPQAAESATQPAPVGDIIPPEVHVEAKAPAPKAMEKAAAPTNETSDKPTPPPPATAPAKATATNNGFLPLALGGVLAGVIGFAVATLTAPDADNTLANQVAEQASAIATLEERIASMPVADLSQIEAVQAMLSSDLSALDATVAEISEQLMALEQRPMGTGTGASAAVSGVEAEMDALRAQIADMTGAAKTELEEARAAAAAIEQNAANAARNAAARAALARVQTSLESGAPIGAALGDLEEATDAAAPEALIAVQDGVPTLASLQEQFPEVARTALATARSEGVAGEETTGIGAFLRNQFDVRSTVPREGNDADAILSRAEAAVRSGRLSDALAEISALPEVVRAEMSDWLALAEARADAIAAVDILSSSLSDN